uniref:Uncharacterized protein n=1 Tax=Rhizophora mucronata TaxID=61149 RepID=A0A2P2NA21_RHIMU
MIVGCTFIIVECILSLSLVLLQVKKICLYITLPFLTQCINMSGLRFQGDEKAFPLILRTKDIRKKQEQKNGFVL